jgi:hypothetical protein
VPRRRRCAVASRRQWKLELQRLSNQTGLRIVVCHFPAPRNENTIEHRLFSFISPNWRGKPLVSHEVIINLTASTTTTARLTICARLDDRDYERGVIVGDEQMATISITRDTFQATGTIR